MGAIAYARQMSAAESFAIDDTTRGEAAALHAEFVRRDLADGRARCVTPSLCANVLA